MAVTGGSGVVGAAVVRHLVSAGHEVRGLARSKESAAKLTSLGASPVDGEVLEEAAVEALVAGCRWVFHVAGVNELCSRDPSWMWKVNVEGSLAATRACVRQGVERLIYTSSAVTIGEEKGAVGSEISPHRGYFLSEYERSKTVAERLILNFADELDIVSVNPSSVQGPGRSTGTGALLLAAARGDLPVLVDSTISLVDIDDCARGHLLAAERGRKGERYILSGSTITVREAVALLKHRLGARSPWFVKASLVVALAPMVDVVFRLMGKPSPLCAESARVLLSGHAYDGSKAARELGLNYTPVDETLLRTLDWFASQGLVADGTG